METHAPYISLLASMELLLKSRVVLGVYRRAQVGFGTQTHMWNTQVAFKAEIWQSSQLQAVPGWHLTANHCHSVLGMQLMR